MAIQISLTERNRADYLDEMVFGEIAINHYTPCIYSETTMNKGCRKNESGAEEGTRTPTPLRVHGPEPCASANSATSARRNPARDRILEANEIRLRHRAERAVVSFYRIVRQASEGRARTLDALQLLVVQRHPLVTNWARAGARHPANTRDGVKLDT